MVVAYINILSNEGAQCPHPLTALEFPAGLAEVTATVLSHNSNSMQETPWSGDWRKRDRWIQSTNNLALYRVQVKNCVIGR